MRPHHTPTGAAGSVPRHLLFGFALLLAAAMQPAAEAEDAAGNPEAQPKDKPKVSVVSVDDLEKARKKAEGKPLLVNLWATWCPPCVKETPELARFYREYKDRVTYLSVSMDDPGYAEDGTMARFMEKHELPFPVRILDSTAPDEAAKALGTEISGTLPVTVLYDASGKPVKTWEGEVTLEQLQEAAQPLVKETDATS